MQNLAKHLYRANTHISRVNPRFCLGVSTLRGQAITAPTIDRPSFKRSVSSLRRLLSFSIYLNSQQNEFRARDRSSPYERYYSMRFHVKEFLSKRPTRSGLNFLVLSYSLWSYRLTRIVRTGSKIGILFAYRNLQ